VAGGGGGAGEEQTAGPGRAERAAGRREEAQAHVDRGARETVAGGVLRRAAEAVRREDRGHRREARLEEERGEGVVLQPAAETEAHEVRRPALTGRLVRQPCTSLPVRHMLILFASTNISTSVTASNHYIGFDDRSEHEFMIEK